MLEYSGTCRTFVDSGPENTIYGIEDIELRFQTSSYYLQFNELWADYSGHTFFPLGDDYKSLIQEKPPKSL